MSARYQDGSIGRFISQDPAFLAVGNDGQIKEITGQELRQYLSDPQNLNSYSYVKNNPLVAVDPNGKWIELIIGEKNAVNLGNWASNNTIAKYATDHPFQTGAVLGVAGGAAVAGGVLIGGGAITCGALCGPVAGTFIAGSGAMGTQADKAVKILNNTNKVLGNEQRQVISQLIQDTKLQNIFNQLYKAKDQLPGGTAGAIRYTAETGKLVGGSDHIQKGVDSLRGLQSVLQNYSLSNQERTIAHTLVNQLTNALSQIKK